MSRHDQEERSSTTSPLWIGLGLVFFFIMCLIGSAYQRQQKKTQFAKQNIVVVRGTVLYAQCEFSPTTKLVTCDSLIVQYPDERGDPQTRTFVVQAHKDSLDAVPQIGSPVLVSWPREYPDEVKVLRLDGTDVFVAPP